MLRVSPEKLLSFFANPLEPVWSSYALDCAIDELTDDPKLRLPIAMIKVHTVFSNCPGDLTESQSEFLHALTLKHYARARKPMSCAELEWLVRAFDREATPQRALMLLHLLSARDLGRERFAQIQELLKGTPGEKWLPKTD